MLRLQKIALLQFKNYTNYEVHFDRQVVGICGANGVGKTSLLDAIYYLCFTKSYFSRTDQQAVQSGVQGFRIDGRMELNKQITELTCIIRENGKKEFLLDGSLYDRMSAHIGKFPVVMIAPDDAVLITGESKERRSFIDQVLAQIDPAYLQSLIRYNRLLQERNALLKEAALAASFDASLLDVLDEQLSVQGQFIYEARKEFLSSFLIEVENQYAAIAADEHSSQSERVKIVYQSHLAKQSMKQALQESRSADFSAQRTTRGIHRDELYFTLLQQPFRQVASQGQRKSLLFALKLAQVNVIKEMMGFSPLLMLDDVFEKLDEKRIMNLLTKVCADSKSQIFITDTSAERLEKQLAKLGVSFQLVSL